jgi:hypothetical protein
MTEPGPQFDTILDALRIMSAQWGLAGASSHSDLQQADGIDQHLRLLERAKRKLQSAQSDQTHNTNLPEAISLLLDIRHSTAYRAVNANTDATPTVSPPTLDFGHLPAWAIQPALGEIHDWWDLPANLFGTGYENDNS